MKNCGFVFNIVFKKLSLIINSKDAVSVETNAKEECRRQNEWT